MMLVTLVFRTTVKFICGFGSPPTVGYPVQVITISDSNFLYRPRHEPEGARPRMPCRFT